MKSSILIVEDEKEIADLIEIYLTREGFLVTKCYDGKSAIEIVSRRNFDLAILDIMLPGATGIEVCQSIRNMHNYPVIILTAKSSEIDKVVGLTIGADDYITKPFLPLELVARVKAQLRRYMDYNNAVYHDTVICHKGLLLDTKAHQCFLNEKEVKLTPTEFSVLKILCENIGKVMSAEELFNQIWEDEVYDKTNNTITVHIRHLRKKMNESFENPKYIKTVWGVGYKIEK